MNVKDFNKLLERHLYLSKEISKRMLKSGKTETSTLIKHKTIIENGNISLRTTIFLLPIRRMRKDEGNILIEDGIIVHDLSEGGMG